MGAYIVRRLGQALIVILLVTIMVFVGMRLLPGDPLYMLFNPNQVATLSPEELQQIRHDAGLDRPMAEQYFSWLWGVFHGDLGKSILAKTPVIRDVAKRVPVTANIGFLAFILGALIGVPLGVIAAIRRGTWLDTLVTTLANIGITVPTFWLGIMLIWVFAVDLRWLPVMGYTSPFTDLGMNVKQLIMPVFCLAIFPIAGNARLARSSMLEVLRQDYIRTAWSKGLAERGVIMRHALKNSLIPIITMAGMSLSTIVGGSVLIEQVFNVPGMGRLALDSLFQHDYPYVQGVTLIVTTVIVLSNLLVDLSYGWLDPRVRYT